MPSNNGILEKNKEKKKSSNIVFTKKSVGDPMGLNLERRCRS